MNFTRLLLAATTLSVAALGCSSGSSDTATEEQKKDPAWIQAKLREMDKNLTPDKPVKTPETKK